MGVNEKLNDRREHHVISNASRTTNSLAPPVRVLNDAFGIEYRMLTTVHAYTASQALVGRAAAASLIPTSTAAAEATALVIPELKGKIDAIALRAPIPDGAITDIVAHLKKRCFRRECQCCVQKGSADPLYIVLDVEPDQ
jgi:glyceraldehyde-3-phosphate dehydrogenase type I